MTVLEQRRYRNPLDIILEEESRTCKGCQYSAEVFDRRYCEKGKKYGKRCGQYVEKEGRR